MPFCTSTNSRQLAENIVLFWLSVNKYSYKIVGLFLRMSFIVSPFKGIPIKMVAAGAEHTAALSEDGELYGWGWGRYGNLGLGDRNDRLLPERVTSIQVCQIYCFILHILFHSAFVPNHHEFFCC